LNAMKCWLKHCVAVRKGPGTTRYHVLSRLSIYVGMYDSAKAQVFRSGVWSDLNGRVRLQAGH
jgi:hypothetical protein